MEEKGSKREKGNFLEKKGNSTRMKIVPFFSFIQIQTNVAKEVKARVCNGHHFFVSLTNIKQLTFYVSKAIIYLFNYFKFDLIMKVKR